MEAHFKELDLLIEYMHYRIDWPQSSKSYYEDHIHGGNMASRRLVLIFEDNGPMPMAFDQWKQITR